MKLILDQAFGGSDFIGYVHANHRLSGRDDEHLHPAAPIYRVTHPEHGLIDIASRQHVNSTRVTATYANSGLEKRQSFQDERFSDHLMEARIDKQAALADQAFDGFDAPGSFKQIYDTLECFASGDTWPVDAVFDTQMYDISNQASFGYASVNILDNADGNADFAAHVPVDMPLAVPTCRR